MKKYERYIVYPTLFIAISIALSTLCRNAPRELGFDYMGIIVGILSLLIGFLVAWQIYNSLQVNEKVKKIEDTQRYLDEKITEEEKKNHYYFLRMECIAKSANALSIADKQPFSAYRLFHSAFIDALNMSDSEHLNGVINNLTTTANLIAELERKGAFIKENKLTIDMDEVEAIIQQKIDDKDLFPLVANYYYSLHRDMRICIKRIKYQMHHKKIIELKS